MVDPTQDAEDARLVALVAEGDRAALGRLYDRFAGLLLALAQRILPDRREAEDIVHDTFLEAWRKASDFDPARGSARAWLVTRARSRALDRRKSVGYARRVSIEEAPALGGEEDLQLDRETVRRALADLSEEQRVVLALGYFEGLSSTEIAERIQAPLGTVKSRVAAALARLRAALGAGKREVAS